MWDWNDDCVGADEPGNHRLIAATERIAKVHIDRDQEWKEQWHGVSVEDYDDAVDAFNAEHATMFGDMLYSLHQWDAAFTGWLFETIDKMIN